MDSAGREEKVSLRALEGLESRLRVLQHHLSPAEDHAPAVERLQSLTAQLDELANKSRAASDLLYFYHEHGDLLDASVPAGRFGSPSPAERLAVVNSCATSFPATVSQLTSLQTLPVPPSDALAALSELHPRLAKAELQQNSTGERVGELRARTAALLQRWHSISVLAAGSCWAEWEERLLRIERAVRHKELLAAEDKVA